MQQVDEEVCANRTTDKVRVVEQLGRKLVESLSNKAPWRSDSCGRNNCLPCKYKAGSCKMRNLTYEIICNLCQEKGIRSVYWGESHRTWLDRFREHQAALANNNSDCAIVK